MPNRSNNERIETSNGIDKKVVILLSILLVSLQRVYHIITVKLGMP